jgi:mRNA interferase RelE/StbE
MPLVYKVFLEKRAEWEIKRLPAEILHRIIPKLKTLSENPKPPGCRRITGAKNDWRIRIGDYRIIYEIDDREKAVKVMRIRHRKEVYK